jgi:hypothetical protein
MVPCLLGVAAHNGLPGKNRQAFLEQVVEDEESRLRADLKEELAHGYHDVLQKHPGI